VIDEPNVICRHGQVKLIGTDGWLMTRSTNIFAQLGLSLLININIKCRPIKGLQNVTANFNIWVKFMLNWSFGFVQDADQVRLSVKRMTYFK
jgi:hypothetical protein